MSQLSIEIEKVSALREKLSDLDALNGMAAEHHVELQDIYAERGAQLDWDSIQRLNDIGILQFLIARIDGSIVGYFSWLLDFDVGDKGTLVANQHAWYVKPGLAVVGVRLLDRAIQEFTNAGVAFAYLHGTVEGRGAKLGRLLESRGAKLATRMYVMKVKQS